LLNRLRVPVSRLAVTPSRRQIGGSRYLVSVQAVAGDVPYVEFQPVPRDVADRGELIGDTRPAKLGVRA
jgi:hypothetical protein